MLEERTPAIVLRTRAYGESDKIVTFLTRDWGKVTGIAKGAKRSRRRFVNVLEPFTHVQLRFRPGRADDLVFILSCDLVRTFRSPSRDLQRFALASYGVELIDALVAGREAGQEMYQLLLQSLTVLDEQDKLSPLFLPTFGLRVLIDVGYAPNLADCHLCGANILAGDSLLTFSPSLGGLLCPQCRGQGGATLRLSAETLSLLRSQQQTDLSSLLRGSAPSRTCHEMQTFVTRLLSRHLLRPLKSLAFLEQPGIQNGPEIDAS